ncbi:MAG: hypothetical protein Q9220_001416 [cf. Caloplaca sp. 1 TL-2023]
MSHDDELYVSGKEKACFLWAPEGVTQSAGRATKRRKISKPSKYLDIERELSTVPLLLGQEDQENVRLRSDLFDTTWIPQKEVILEYIDNAAVDTVNQLIKFIQGLSQIATDYDDTEDENRSESEHPRRRLNYDLQILHDHVQRRAIQKVVLAFHDSETFDGELLSELIDILSFWCDRIPFICLFSIKTSVELFEEKLDKRTTLLLQGVQFEVAPINIDNVFKTAMSLHRPGLFWLGPAISSMISQAQQDSMQSVTSFSRSLQYASMTHVFANPLSVLLQEPFQTNMFQEQIYECIRNLPSFKELAETLLDQQEFRTLRQLLNDDLVLHRRVAEKLQSGRNSLSAIVAAVELLVSLQSHINIKNKASWTNLYIEAMAGQLKDSTLIEEILSALKRLPSDNMTRLLHDLEDSSVLGMSNFVDDLAKLESERDNSKPLHSEYVTAHQNLRTTVVAHKVELSRHSSSLSKQDLLYSELVKRIELYVRAYLERVLINPQDLFLCEVLVFDLRTPCREVFGPKPRFAVERALNSAGDYLGCSCCKGAQHGLSATQPAVSILYQLYLESGTIINISDLWSAFYTIVAPDESDDQDAEQEKALALFSRALAELKYLGMIKNSRKKPDHLGKILWNGL